MNKYLMTSVAALVLSLAGCSNIERSRDLGDPSVTGQTLAQQVCSNCHGVDGNSVSPAFPRLAGQQPAYITSQLVNFRSHARMDPPGYQYMWGLSRSLTDAQIAGLAAYYAAQPVRLAPSAPPNAKLMAVGQTIFEQGVPQENVIACSACHGPKGQGIEGFPRLANQHADYLVKQLNVFQNTQQRPGTPMEYVVHPLTGADKEAVATYLQSFPQ